MACEDTSAQAAVMSLGCWARSRIGGVSGTGARRVPTARLLSLLSAALVAVLLAVYWPAFRYDFLLYDDPESVMANPLVRGGLSWQGLADAFRAPHAGFWIPVTWLSYMLDAQVFGTGPRGFHVTNVLLHSANAVLLLLALWKLTGAVWQSALAAALFALHPLRVESVAWIAQRKDLLAGSFFLVALLAYATYARRGGALRYAGVALALVFGFLSKPVLVCAPFVFLLLDFWPLGRLRSEPAGAPVALHRVLLEKVPFFALSAVFAGVALWAHGDAVAPVEAFSMLRRLELSSSSYFVYLKRMVWPTDLALVTADFRPWVDPGRLAAGALGLGAVSFAVCRLARRAPYLLVGWFWYLMLLLPMSGLLPSGIWSTADRFTYVPQIGLCIGVAWGLGAVWPVRGRAGAGAVLASLSLLTVLAAVSREQVSFWRNTESLFSRALAVEPEDPFAHEKLGQVLLARGDLEGAVQHLRRALAVTPKNPFAHAQLGLALGRMGDLRAAANHLGRAVELDPSSEEARFNLAVALTALGRREEAVEQYRAALRLRPGDEEARYNLDLLLSGQGGRP